MVPRWTTSADKHGVARSDAVYAILHRTYTDVLAGEPREDGRVRLFIGPRHAQALPDDEIEMLVHEYPGHPGREAVVFHVQPSVPSSAGADRRTVMSDKPIDYDALAARLTDPDHPVRSAGHVETSDASDAAGRDWLLREYGSTEAIETEIRRGRPRVGDTKRGPSPTVRARLSDADFQAFEQLRETTGRGQSELVREAIHDYLARHAAG